LRKFAHKLNADLRFDTDDNLHLNEFQFFSTVNGKKLEV
jgi:ribonuclease G